MDKLIETIVSAIEDKKGKDIVSLDLSGFDGAICSRFIVCNADSTTQVCAIAASIEEKVLETLGEKVWRIEGQQNGVWVAMDYVDVWCISSRPNCAVSTNSKSCGPTHP
jgi:ribosome-associated protein